MFKFIKQNARWLIGAFLLALFSGFGQTFFISLFSENIRSHFSLTNGQFGMLYMAATLCSATVFLNLGVVVDRFPAANVAAAVLLSLSIATATMVICNSVWLLFVCLFCLRLFGQGMLLHVSQTAIGRWFEAERGRAIALTSMGLNFGESLLPTLVWVTTLWVSWRFCWGLASISALLAIPVTYQLMKVPRNPKTKNQLDSNSKFALKHWTRKDVIRDPLFWLASPAIFAPAFIATAIFFHHQHLVALKAWPEGSFEPGFILLSIFTVAAKFCAGPLIDRFGAIRLLWVYHIPLGLSCLLLGQGQGIAFIYLSMPLIGIAMGFATSIFGTLWPELYGTKHLGAIRSIAVAGIVFASACGSGVTGWLIDHELGFESQLNLMAAWCVVSTMTQLFASRLMINRATTYPAA